MEVLPPVEPESGTRKGPGDFALAPGRGRLVLETHGLHHPRSTLLGGLGSLGGLGRIAGRVFTPWEAISDLAVGRPGLRLATRQGVFLLRRAAFRDRRGPEALAQALLAGLTARPGGADQLARLQALGERAARTPEPRAVRFFAALCGVAFVFQAAFAPAVELTGLFSATLVSLGEYWRLVTANLLHGGIGHLAVNAICLIVIGGLAERSLGAAATVLVMGVSGLGAMGASWGAGYEAALGASGVVAGLAGALLALELRHPESLPAAWRLPRRSFLVVVGLEAALSLGFPFVAHAAHAGGFVAGGVAAFFTGPAPHPEAAESGRPRLAVANALLVALFVVGSVHGVRLSLEPGPAALERRATVLLNLETVSPWLLNNEAWLIATAEDPLPRSLDTALRLAERAVELSDRLDPNVLDTLAEVHFAAGRAGEARAVIDEAIRLAPGEDYFREQRRRFSGERAPGDRPDPPRPSGPDAPFEAPWGVPDPPQGPQPQGDPGVRV